MNGRNLKMELDTGSAISTLPFQKYKELFLKTPLVKTEAILKTYSGERLIPEGKLYVSVEHNNQVKDLTLYVVDTHGPALFGRDWLHQIQLDWNLICFIAHMQPTQATQKILERLLEKELVRSTPDRVVRVRVLAGDIVLCSWARHFTLTVPLSTQVYKWVPANLMPGVTLLWTGIPSRGE